MDDGRVPDGTGLSQAEPQEGLGPTGFDPSRVCQLCRGRGYYLERFADNFFTSCRACNPHAGMRAAT